jgi:hypothetical protein
LCVKALQPDPGIFRKWLLFWSASLKL